MMIIFCLLSISIVFSNILKVEVDHKSGSYSLYVNGEHWMSSSYLGFVKEKKLYASSSGLKLNNVSESEGKDKFDSFHKYSMEWATLDGSTHFITEITQYDNLDMVLFDQIFPDGASESSLRNLNTDISTIFPSFQNVLPSTKRLNYHSYKSTFCVPQNGAWEDGSFTGGALSSPVALYTNESQILFSPLNTLMVGNMIGMKVDEKMTLQCGLQGMVNLIPKNYNYRSILVGSNEGMTDLYLKWGDYMLSTYNKRRTEMDDDVFFKKLGYWTDNGAFYYYITEPNKNYEQTILDVWDYIKTSKIPVGNIQYDSWWYYRAKDNGLWLWEPKPEIFPSGMKYLYDKLDNIPVALHNRWFAFTNEYMQSNFSFEFYEGDGCSLPKNQDVYDYIMKKAKGWGMTMYEQDWLSNTYTRMDQVQNNTRIGGEWMMNMANAAKGLDLTIQLCMPYPAHIMQTLPMGNVVTHARASNDYNPKRDQWNIGQTSLFYWALGVVPFKDNFWTTSEFEHDCKYTVCEESNPEMQAVVACLSNGPVGFSDKIGMANIPLLNEISSVDGTLMKTDRPAFTIDFMFQDTFSDWAGVEINEVWSTYTCFEGVGCYFYVLAIDLAKDIDFETWMLPKDMDQKLKKKPTHYFAVKYEMGKKEVEDLKYFDDKKPIKLKKTGWHPITDKIGWEMYVIAPVFKDSCDWTFIKEMKKIVSVSKTRVSQISCQDDSLDMVVEGSKGEEITLAVFNVKGSLHYPVCNIGETGKAKMSCQNGKCSC